MMGITELRDELLRSAYPFLTPDSDPDIERYFELRGIGHAAEALALYKHKLIPRYPYQAFRSRLIRAYRLRRPEYPSLLKAAYNELGKRILERTKRIIKYIAVHSDSYDPTDVYSTIKAAESIMSMLPKERYEAIFTMERLLRYAHSLDYCVSAISKAEALIRAYLTESLGVVQDSRRRRAKSIRAKEYEARQRLVRQDKEDFSRALKRKKKASAIPQLIRRAPKPIHHHPVLDLSSIRFSATDLNRIQIPPILSKVEDKTLAFCFKYWNLINDTAFERVLFLYSRKNQSKHYEVFTAIQRGRKLGKRDDEILASVMSILITGYYYSIRGDMYLQRNWKRLKGTIEGTLEQQIMKPMPHPIRHKGKSSAKRLRVHRSKNSSVRPKSSPSQKVKLQQKQASERSVSVPSEGTGSVADRLRRLSGRPYDLYRDIFLAKARPAIRKVLRQNKGLFHTPPGELEDMVFQFLRDHYSDPYMDWEHCEERKKLEAHEYALVTLDPIIDECFTDMGK